jgi:hypothetical protein
LQDNLIFSNLQDGLQKTKTEEKKAKVSAQRIRERYSPAQAAAASDRARFRAVLACRRTGKSYWAGSELVYKAITTPMSQCLYVTLTKGSGRGILWSFLKQMNQQLGLDAHFHNTNLTAVYPGGGQIDILGAENRGEIDKIRGRGYDLVIIDECKSFPPSVLEELMEEVIGPALIDRQGRFVLIGTPGAILSGPFYEITDKFIGQTSRLWAKRAVHKGKFKWSVHKWGLKEAALDIVYPEAMAMKESNDWPDDHPVWQREYLGKWVASDDALVYKYEKYGDGRNTWTKDPNSDNAFGLPSGHKWRFLLGLDLGFEDDFALEVAAYSDTHPNLYQVYDFKANHLILPEIAREIEVAIGIFGEFEIMIGDQGGLGKTLLATLAEQYGLSVIPAEKREKLDHIELLNSDLVSGRCKILEDSLLAEEMRVLQFDSTGVREHPGCANHACDAFLYLWRWAYHHFHGKKAEEPEKGTPEWNKAEDKRQFDRAVAQRVRDEQMDWWEKDFDEPAEVIENDFSSYLGEEW